MKDEQEPRKAPDPLPTIIRGLKPEELFARGMQSVKFSSAGPQGPWRPPRVEEMARLFPGFEILALLGHGGMGAVYRARQTALDRIVAIKLLPLEAGRDYEFTERFKREAQTMARLHHPNLVALYNFGQTTEGHLFFIMEHVEGATLHDLLHTPGALTPDRVARIVTEICEGLACAHREGVVHRDIKPANILVDVNGHAKVADFGLARSTRQNSGQTLTIKGMAVGTPDYMAPEQRRGERVDQRADIYAIGIVLYEALTRQLPRGVFAPASKLAGTPRLLDDVIAHAMHQDPSKRFQSTMEMKLALEEALAGRKHAVPAEPTVVSPRHLDTTPAQPQRNHTGTWIAIAASVAVIGSLGFALLRPAKSVRPVAPRYQPTPAPLATPAPFNVAKTSSTPTTRPSATATPSSATAEPLTFGDSRYQLVRSKASWMQAKTEAEFKGGHLATITSKEEAEWVRKTFGPELTVRWMRIWIGAYQTDHNDSWHWVTDEEFKFSDWIPGEPNAARGSTITPPFCASLSNSLEAPGSNGWDDSAASGGANVVGYLVEWDGPKTATPVAMATPAATPASTTTAMVTPAPSTPTPPTAPSANEAEQRLALHKAQYDAAYERDIAKTFDAGREALRANYQAAIDREIAKLAQAGKLTDAVALREERVRAATGRGLEGDDSALPAVLKPLRASYRTNLTKLETARAAKLKPIRDGYLRLLDASQAEFTRAQKLDAALVMKTQREKLTTEWAAEQTAALPAVAEATRPSLSAPGAATDSVSSWRRVAQLVLRSGGKIEIKIDGKRMPLTLEAEIPNRRFEPTKIELFDVQKNEKLTDADLASLASCKELEDLRIERAPITSKGLEVLRGLPALKTLRIHYCKAVNDQFMPAVATLDALTNAELHHNSITGEGLKHLTRCSKLRRLSLHGRSIPAASLTQLGQLSIEELSLSDLADPTTLDLSAFKRLRHLSLISMRDAKVRIIDEVSKIKSLEILRFNGCNISDDDLPKLAGLSSVKTLEFEQNAIKGSGLAGLRSARSLTKLRLHNCQVTDAALDVIGRDLSGLQAIIISGAATVQAAAFRNLGKLRGLKEVSVSDGVGNDDVVATLATLPTLELINLSQCPELSDAGLQPLSRLKSLKRLTLNNCSKLTGAGVDSFRKARPDVTVNR